MLLSGKNPEKSEHAMTTTARKASAGKSTEASKSPSKSKSSSAKPAAEASAAKPAEAPAARPAGAVVTEAATSVVLGTVMGKKELIDSVVAQSGLKKKTVKPVVETMLAVLGEALQQNRELNLQPFGRLKVRKERNLQNGRMVVAKIRQSGQTGAPTAAPAKEK